MKLSAAYNSTDRELLLVQVDLSRLLADMEAAAWATQLLVVICRDKTVQHTLTQHPHYLKIVSAMAERHAFAALAEAWAPSFDGDNAGVHTAPSFLKIIDS